LNLTPLESSSYNVNFIEPDSPCKTILNVESHVGFGPWHMLVFRVNSPISTSTTVCKEEILLDLKGLSLPMVLVSLLLRLAADFTVTETVPPTAFLRKLIGGKVKQRRRGSTISFAIVSDSSLTYYDSISNESSIK
jgi:hypothetical protein